MAGEWIPIDITLGSKPEVQELVDLTGQPVEVVVYRLLQLWGWASLNSADGTARATPARLARVCGGDEPFWLSVEAVGWISFDDESVTISKWGDRFSSAAKARAVDRKRKNPTKVDTFRKVSGKIPNDGGRNLDYRTGQDRTGEKNTNTAPSVARTATATLVWDSLEGWVGITDADRTAWATAYPAASLTAELAKASEWLRANPTKAKRSNWRKFLTGWLTRCQDGGGTDRGNGRRPADERPPPKAWKDDYQPAPYRTPVEAQQLAQKLKVPT